MDRPHRVRKSEPDYAFLHVLILVLVQFENFNGSQCMHFLFAALFVHKMQS